MFNNKRGFTLLEVIVVLIIIGILASIALPAYFKAVDQSGASEAQAELGSIKSLVDACLDANVGLEATKCGNLAFSNSPNFSYAFGPDVPLNSPPGNSNGTSSCQIELRATSLTNVNNFLVFMRDGNGNWSCLASGVYFGVCAQYVPY